MDNIQKKRNILSPLLYVKNHMIALLKVLVLVDAGETYNIGSNNVKTNREVVVMNCEILDKLLPNNNTEILSYKDLIVYVKDRPGHDKRYAIDSSKIRSNLKYLPEEFFEAELLKTIKWYLYNNEWCQGFSDGSYQGERLGLMEELKI